MSKRLVTDILIPYPKTFTSHEIAQKQNDFFLFTSDSSKVTKIDKIRWRITRFILNFKCNNLWLYNNYNPYHHFCIAHADCYSIPMLKRFYPIMNEFHRIFTHYRYGSKTRQLILTRNQEDPALLHQLSFYFEPMIDDFLYALEHLDNPEPLPEKEQSVKGLLVLEESLSALNDLSIRLATLVNPK